MPVQFVFLKIFPSVYLKFKKKDEIQKQLKMFIADRTKDNHVVSEVEDDVLF